MFHVERNLTRSVFKGNILLFAFIFVYIGCGVAKQNIQISDYLLVPNGIEMGGNKDLTAFIFENNRRKLPIEQFLYEKYNSNSLNENEFWVTIDKDKYKLIVYDFAEFEKYFNSSNFAVINLEPENIKTEDKREFIAISMINEYNEDCLANNSLYQNTAVKYLKKLKDEYYNQ